MTHIADFDNSSKRHEYTHRRTVAEDADIGKFIEWDAYISIQFSAVSSSGMPGIGHAGY